MHTTADETVATISPCGRERGRVHVTLELDDSTRVPAVRLAGAADTPMTPAQALRLSAVLMATALTSLGAE